MRGHGSFVGPTPCSSPVTLGHALRIEPVVLAHAPGSPLYDLDDALPRAADGGLGSFFARRNAEKRSGAETAASGWRTLSENPPPSWNGATDPDPGHQSWQLRRKPRV